MENIIEFTKEDIDKMEPLSEEELKKLNFHELCAYLGALDLMETILE